MTEYDISNCEGPFYKVVRKDMTHYGFTYKEGLNVDPNEFDPSNFCAKGGLYFTTKKELPSYMSLGDMIATVYVPEGIEYVTMSSKMKAPQLIIVKVEPFEDFFELDSDDFYADYNLKSRVINAMFSPDDGKYITRWNNNIIETMIDNSISLEYVPEEYRTGRICQIAVKKDPGNLTHVPVQTNDLVYMAVAIHVNALEFVKNRTAGLCTNAVIKFPDAMKYCKNMSESFYCTVVRRIPSILKHIPVDVQTSKIVKIAVSADGKAIRHINPELLTKELFITALLTNPDAAKDCYWFYNYTPWMQEVLAENMHFLKSLKFIRNPTDAQIKYALANYSNDNVAPYIDRKNVSDEIGRLMIEKNPLNLEYVWNQTPEMCMDAVLRNYYALKHVKNQTPEICMAAVKKSGTSLQYVKNQTPEICMAAIRTDPNAICYVEKPSFWMCLVAVMKNSYYLKEVKKIDAYCLIYFIITLMSAFHWFKNSVWNRSKNSVERLFKKVFRSTASTQSYTDSNYYYSRTKRNDSHIKKSDFKFLKRRIAMSHVSPKSTRVMKTIWIK